MGEKKTIVHLIPSMCIGGAEASLLKLVMATQHIYRHHVFCLQSRGKWFVHSEINGVSMEIIDLQNNPLRLAELYLKVLGLVKHSESPVILHGWMIHANFLASLLHMVLPNTRLVWCNRASSFRHEDFPLISLLLETINRKLLIRFPSVVISNCSGEARRYRAAQASLWIPNGFSPSSHLRLRGPAKMERLLGRLKRPVIAMVARWHPQKDHVTCLRSLEIVRRFGWRGQAILAGPGIHKKNRVLQGLLQSFGLKKHVFPLGTKLSPSRIYQAADLLVLSSRSGEGFPNVLAEAMLYGVPCVTTDIGDSGVIVGSLGRVCRPESPPDLARGILEVLAGPRGKNSQRGKDCRDRIQSTFPMGKMLQGFIKAWEKAVVA